MTDATVQGQFDSGGTAQFVATARVPENAVKSVSILDAGDGYDLSGKLKLADNTVLALNGKYNPMAGGGFTLKAASADKAYAIGGFYNAKTKTPSGAQVVPFTKSGTWSAGSPIAVTKAATDVKIDEAAAAPVNDPALETAMDNAVAELADPDTALKGGYYDNYPATTKFGAQDEFEAYKVITIDNAKKTAYEANLTAKSFSKTKCDDDGDVGQ